MELRNAWEKTIEHLQKSTNISQASLAFLHMCHYVNEFEGNPLVSVPNDHTKNNIENRCQPILNDTLSKFYGSPVKIALIVDPSLEKLAPQTFPTPSDDKNDDITIPVSSFQHTEDAHPTLSPSSQDQLATVTPLNPNLREANLNPQYTFDTWVIGSSNRFAHAAATAVAELPAESYNPLFIYGDSGLGKTHLLHAIGHYAMNLFPNIKVKYINSEEFTNDFINSIRQGHSLEFKQRYREVDILLIDDIQFLQGKEQTVEEFFHTFNTLHNSQKQVVITSDLPPKKLSGFEDRLRSRFEMGLLTDIQPPDIETRIAILSNRARQENLNIPDSVLEYIAEHFATNIRELEGALARIAIASSFQEKDNEKPMSLDFARETLKDIISDPQDHEVTISLIKTQASTYFDLTISQLCSQDRSKDVSTARQIAMYLCRELTTTSLPKIGDEFGGRDHTTVMYATKKIPQRMKAEPSVFHDVTELTNRVKQAARNRK
ncbi:MAG: chromosomal replication initiator protein DnaA [Vagococcus sp.]|nr:chromosomal replication initiator protein DnaA [Vagococcus sp.]